MRTAESPVFGCAAARYPRKLAHVLPAADAQFLTRLYFERVRGQFALRYYGLLHHLGHAQPSEFEQAMSVLRKLQARIAREFGAEFVMVNDFFSFRNMDESRVRVSLRVLL